MELVSDREHGADVRAFASQRDQPPTVRRDNVTYKIVVTYGVLDLMTLQSSFYKQTYRVIAWVPLLWALHWVRWLIDLRYCFGADAVDIKQMEVLYGYGYTGTKSAISSATTV